MSKHLKLRLRHARARSRRRVFTAGRREVALFAAVYLSYDVARWAWAGHLSRARAHAQWVIAFERSLHIAVEGSVQRALDSAVPSFLLANVYLAAQAVALPAALIWLYRRSPMIYGQLRGTVVTTWLIATPIFALYPVAPPRLAGIGIEDIVSHQAVVTLTGSSTLFYNPYASVPSLHVGLAFAIGIAAAAALRRPWAKALALLWGPLVTLAVVTTGNHYFFDVAAGLVVAAVAFATTRALSLSRVQLHPVSRAVAVGKSDASVTAARPLLLPALAAAGLAAGRHADHPSASPAAARPNQPILVRRLAPEIAAGGCRS